MQSGSSFRHCASRFLAKREVHCSGALHLSSSFRHFVSRFFAKREVHCSGALHLSSSFRHFVSKFLVSLLELGLGSGKS